MIETAKKGWFWISDVFMAKMIKYTKPLSNLRIEWANNIVGIYSKGEMFMTDEQKEVLAEAVEYLKSVKVKTKHDEIELAKYLDDMEKKVNG